MAKTIENISFEDALAELEKIVRQLEEGKTPLEESIKAYERGIELKTYCESKLKDAQLTIEKIALKEDGSIGKEKFAE